jgi:hypothetical protein
MQLSGTLPRYLGDMKLLSELKFEVNDIVGTIPPELGLLPRLRRFQSSNNAMTGPIPDTFR